MLSFRLTTVVVVSAATLLVGSARSQAQSECNGNGLPDNCGFSCGPPGGLCDVPDGG